MASVRDYINDNLNEARIGNAELNDMASKAMEMARKIPSGPGMHNRLAKAGESAMASKLMQAQKMKEELQALKKKIPTLKDMDDAGRKAAKASLKRLMTGLAKFEGFEGQAEKALAAKDSAGKVQASHDKAAAKKKDFKDRVRANLDRKKQERTDKVKSMVGKAKAKMRHSMASFKN